MILTGFIESEEISLTYEIPNLKSYLEKRIEDKQEIILDKKIRVGADHTFRIQIYIWAFKDRHYYWENIGHVITESIDNKTPLEEMEFLYFRAFDVDTPQYEECSESSQCSYTWDCLNDLPENQIIKYGIKIRIPVTDFGFVGYENRLSTSWIFHDQESSDVKVVVQGKVIRAHRQVLADNSKVFLKLLEWQVRIF